MYGDRILETMKEVTPHVCFMVTSDLNIRCQGSIIKIGINEKSNYTYFVPTERHSQGYSWTDIKQQKHQKFLFKLKLRNS